MQTDYTWDYRDRMTEATFKDSSHTVTKTVGYASDAFNRLVKESVAGPQTGGGSTVVVPGLP